MSSIWETVRDGLSVAGTAGTGLALDALRRFKRTEKNADLALKRVREIKEYLDRVRAAWRLDMQSFKQDVNERLQQASLYTQKSTDSRPELENEARQAAQWVLQDRERKLEELERQVADLRAQFLEETRERTKAWQDLQRMIGRLEGQLSMLTK